MPRKHDKEKRRGIRVDFGTQIILTVDGSDSESKIEGSSKDLSLKGVFINTTEEISVGSKCKVKVLLTGMSEAIVLKMQGDVARRTPSGIAIDFNLMDIDSYTHLKNIVKYNAPEIDDIY